MITRSLPLLLSLFLLFGLDAQGQSCNCGGSVPTYDVDLTGDPDTTWSTSDTRNGYCCDASGSTRCIKFNVSLHPEATQIGFDVTNPSPPGGAFYQVNCGPEIPLDSNLCIVGISTPFCITYCKSGNDNANYTISSSKGYSNSGATSVRQGCSDTLGVTGFQENTIDWTSVYPGADGDYDGYLSCADSCDTTLVTPAAGAPDTILYEVSGELSGCSGTTFRDTLPVYTFPGMTVDIIPDTAYVCVGESDATLEAEPTGGAPPYSFLWSNGSTDSTITVGTGTYSVEVTDTTDGCPPVTDTAEVLSQDTVDTPTASSNSPVCEGDSIVLDASTISGVDYHWYGPNGFTASSEDTTLYNVTLSDSGTYSVYATKNGCSSDTSSTNVEVNPIPSAPSASNNGPLCEGQTLDLSATSISGATYSWSGPNGFSSSQQNPSVPNVTMSDSGMYYVKVTVNGCTSNEDSTLVDIDPTPSAPTAGSNSPVCEGNSLDLTASTISGASYSWSGPNGFSSTQQNPSISGVTLSDSGWYAVTATVNGCTSPKDSVLVDIDDGETADAGSDQFVCADRDSIQLNGSTSTGTGSWSTSGTGSFSPSNTDLNASYLPSSTDTSNGSVDLYLGSTNNGACGPTEDTMTIYFRSVPVADAGPDDTVCANAADVPLNGSVSDASGGEWSTSGDGTFDDSTSLSTTYRAGPNDTANGSVILSLTTTGNGVCDPDTDSMTVTITDAPVVDAGSDTLVCKTVDTVAISGSVSAGATQGDWSTLGTGSFEDPNALNTDYYPSSDDTAAGYVDLTLTSSDNGDCDPVTDTMRIDFFDAPVADAGPDQTICANSDTASLNGGSTTGSGEWSTSGTGTFQDPTDTITSYYASDADTAAGSVTLSLATTNNAGCDGDTASMTLTITDAPHPDAGPDDTVCANNATASLNGEVYVASGGVWSTAGDGSFGDSSSLSTTYTAGPNDTANGSVELYLTTTGNGDCNPETDTMLLTITDAPVVEAGPDTLVCKTEDTVAVSGSVSAGASQGDWSTLGTGTFEDPSALSTDYYPSSNDTAAGSVDLVLTSSDNGDCNPVSDTMTLSFLEPPTADAGPDKTVCANSDTAFLDGWSSTGSGEWITSGSGSFETPTDTNTYYYASDADTAAGSVTLTLITTNNGTCDPDSNSMDLTITDAPHPDAGPDDTVCANNATASLNGEVYVASSGVWSTAGDGTFGDSSSLSTTYTAGPNDTANGSVELYLTTTGNGDCNPEMDTLLLTITDAPVVEAGSDRLVCKTQDSVSLNGSVSAGASKGEWSTLGTGSFADSSVLGTDYYPGSGDTAAGKVDLVLTSTDNGDCNPVSDTMRIDFFDAPEADAGPDQTVCANSDTASLNGGSTTGSGEWSSSGTGTFQDPTDTITSYYASDADTAAGSVTLSLATTNNGSCEGDTSSMTLTITDAPHPDAGPDDTVCANNATASLNGEVYVASGGVWSTAGDGSFGDSSSLSTTYTAGPNDTANGSVELYLTTTGNGICNPETDTLLLTITDAPVVDAGSDQLICKTDDTVDVVGSVSAGASQGEWSTLGTGSFEDSSALNTNYYPSSGDTSAGDVDLVLTSTDDGDCDPVSDTMNVAFVEPPTADAGPDRTVCANADTAFLDGWSSTGSGEWSTSGSGSFADKTDTNTFYYASDADTAAGSVTLTLVSTNNGTCESDSSSMTLTITDAPIADAGPDQSVCANSDTVSLNGSVQVASGGIWSTAGDGSFADSSSLSTTYDAGPNDTANGSVELYLTTTGNGDCNPVTDTMTLTITDAPVVDAGSSPIYSCLSDPTTPLNGSSSTGSGQWSTMGSGTFQPSGSILGPDYEPSSADTANGSVQLVLTSTNNGNCLPESDTVTVEFTPVQKVDAGSDTTLCANNDDLQLDGEVTNGSPTGEWSTSGSGTFSPNDSTLDAVYSPSDSDTAAGSVDLILTSTKGCEAVKDTLTLTITDAPVVDAGSDIVRCKDDPVATLNGSVSGGSSSGVWSTSGSGSFSPDSTTLDADYIPSSADTMNGSVDLVLTSTNNGNCLAESDTMTIDYVNAPQANAGPDQVVCANTNVQLDGNIKNGSGTGKWSTPNGTGTFLPSDTVLDGEYRFSDADTTNGSVTLVLSSTNNGNCTPSRDTMNVTITPAPKADAGPDRSVCANDDTVDLNGSVKIATGGEWSTTGGGSFTPSDSILDPTYVPDSTDSANGGASLILTTTGNGDCNPVSDTMDLTIKPAPQVDAGSNAYICEGDTSADLNGSITGGASTGQWSSSGTGSFDPSNTDLNATYQMSDADTAAGSVTLTLTSTNNGNCLAESDSMEVVVTTAATVSASGDTTLCSDRLDSVQVHGSVSGGSGIGEWNSSGYGSFTPSDTSMDPYYQLATQDTVGGSVTLEFYSIKSCESDTDSVTIDFIPAPEADAGSDMTVCEGEDAQLNGSFVNANGGVWNSSGTGQFLPNDSTLDATYVPSQADIDSGGVMLDLQTYGNSASCGQGLDTMELMIGQQPIAGFEHEPACVGEDGRFIDTSSVERDSLVDWQYVIGGDSLMGPDTTYSYGSSGSIQAQLTVTTDKGCKDTALRTLTIDPTPSASFGDSITCGREVYFSDSSSIAGGSIDTWDWSFGDGDSSKSRDPVHAYSDSGDYPVRLRVVSDSGCEASSMDSISLGSAPLAEYEPAGASRVVGEPIEFDNLSMNDSSSLWIFGDGKNSDLETPTHVFEEEGDYEVSLIVTDANECRDTVTYLFKIGPADDTRPVAVPSAFTPNNDGRNDVLHVLGGPMKEMSFSIYNEWGERIFRTEDPDKGWDGTINGKPQPSGTYVYILKGVTENGKEIERSGEVNLIR